MSPNAVFFHHPAPSAREDLVISDAKNPCPGYTAAGLYLDLYCIGDIPVIFLNVVLNAFVSV